MGKDTAISWAHHTFNPWWGCTKIEGSPACDTCYAETFANRVGYGPNPTDVNKFPIWGADTGRRTFGAKHWNEPLKWSRDAELSGIMARAFCMSMGDWAEGRPDQKPHLERLGYTINATLALYWLMLTKRPQLINKLMPVKNHPRVWQGITAERQDWLELRWRHLREVQAAVYWLSIEPMFGALTLPEDFLALGSRAWVIVGGESGSRATPIDVAAAIRLKDQCREAGVAFHFKQMSGRTKAQLEDIPPQLRVRQYPLGITEGKI